MEKDVLLSIIIPVYNAESFIEKTLECIFPQLNCQTELILVDDGSIDNTYKIIDEYIFEHSDFIEVNKPTVILLNQSNGGCSKARNYGLSKCSGMYVTFIDADDAVKPDYLSTFITIIRQNKEFDVCITGVETYGEDGSLYERVQNTNAYYETHESSVNAIVSEVAKVAFPMWCKIIRMDFLREHRIAFDDGAICMSDGLFYTNVYQHIEKLLMTDYVGYEWRRRPGSISATYYDVTVDLACRYAENCRKIVESVAGFETDKVAIEWLLKKKKFSFDYVMSKIDCSSISYSRRKNAIKKTIDRCLDYEIICAYYTCVDRMLLTLSKKYDAYFYYGLMIIIKIMSHNYERVMAAIKRRVVRR